MSIDVVVVLPCVPDTAMPSPPAITDESAAARGLSRLPENGSFLTIDQWLGDLGLTPSLWRRRGELFGPMLPSVYADVLGRLKDRLRRSGARALPPVL